MCTQQTDKGKGKQVNRQKKNHRHTDILKATRVHKVKGHGLLVTLWGL